MKRLLRNVGIFQTQQLAEKYKSIFSAEDDTEFGDPSDIRLTGDVEKDFNTVVEMLRDTSYEDLGPALEDIVNDPKLYKLLSEGFGNGELAEVDMSSSTVAIPVTQLLPSQSEIGLDNSLSYPLKQDCSNLFNSPVTIVSPIITYRKTFIIDGHHRWSQLYMMNPSAKINAINFNYNEQSPYRALRNFQGAIAVAHKQVPKSFSKVNNVYDMSESEIESYIDSNMKDACWQSLVKQEVCEDRDSAIEYILGNIKELRNDNPPFANAPEREYMPQTNEKSIEIAEEGQTDI